MKIVILQFSGTGNTFALARILQDILIGYGHETDLFPIESVSDPASLLLKYDLFGLAYPIYGSDLPKIVRKLIDSLDTNTNQRGFVFCSQYLFSGDGAAYAARLLINKGYVIRQLAHFNMPNNIADIMRFLPIGEAKPKLMKRKEKEVKRFASKIHFDKLCLKGMNVFSQFMGLSQRAPFQKFGDVMFDHAIKVDSCCTLCGRCIEICPVGNLSIDEGKIKEHNRCLLCYRCINHCPEGALHIHKSKSVRFQYKGPYAGFVIDDVKKTYLASERAVMRRHDSS
ncbi:MAG: EFR1 family ferrodoxin [Candidatus Izemoplasmatales bacterium]|nr:EFR1 family ferrodoxin [Candidatus Izemoplasmatales bacterium]